MSKNKNILESISFSEEETNNFIELGIVLKGIHQRLVMEERFIKTDISDNEVEK